MTKRDPVTGYAWAVVEGLIVASRLMRQACQRHLDDLEHQEARGLEWRPAAAQRVIDFFAEVLCLPERTDADEAVTVRDDAGEAKPFHLEPWQQFIAGSMFGWYTKNGFRRFREAYIETAKGSGKTPLGAGMMLYLLVADGERGAQIFLAAVKRDQADVAWRDVLAMVEASKPLRDLLDRRANNLAVEEDASFLRPVSSEKRGLDGKRVHGALVDELHEHPNGIVVNKMRAGTKGRRNAMIVKTTNSGFDRSSVCWQHHEYSRKVLEGTVSAEAAAPWFCFICGLDPCDACADAGKWFPSDDCAKCDQWSVEGEHWRKANPNLGVSLPWQYVRERVDQAKGMPSEVSDVLRFNFCVWTQGASRAIDMGKWAACGAFPSDHELLGAPCYGGLDLGESDDFSAWARGWVLPDGRLAVKLRFWAPRGAIERFPNRPYQEFERAGILTITDGDITDYAQVSADILADCRQDGVIAVAYDTRAASMLAQGLMAEGVDMIPTAQGFALHEAITRLLEMIAEGTLCHGNNRLLTLMASNTVLQNGTGQYTNKKRLAKEKSPEKIDGIGAVCNLIDWAIVRSARPQKAPDPVMVFA